MKIKSFKNYAGLGLATLLLAGGSLSYAQVPVTNMINSFDAAGSYGGGIGQEWGSGAVAFDSTVGNPTAGAELITVTWDPGSDTPTTAYACKGDGANPWYTPNPITFSSYDTLQFDIKYDPTSDITIDQFNDVSTWPLSLTNSASGNQSVFQSWAGAGQIAAGGSIGGLEIDLCGGPGGQMAPFIVNTNIPAAAASGWVHIVIPINKALSQIDGVSGIVFHKWCANTWTLQTPVSARFWIDNVQLVGTSAPPPPPKLSVPSPAVQGLNVFASTEGNSFYDRQHVLLRQTNGLSWISHATSGNPVSYSFTIGGYPNSVNCEAWLYLVPNPASFDNAPDWNETNCVIARIQGDNSSALMQFRYKVNEDHQQAMYSGGNEARGYYTNAPGSWDGVTAGYLESGSLGSVTNNGVRGTWTVRFTSDTNITLIAPNGNTSSFVMPPYNAGYFAETRSFNIYLGMQANNADAMNQSVVYTSFAATGVATPYSENFLADSYLDTTNIWNTGYAGGPKGVCLVPAGSASWVAWTLPDTGFSLETSPTLNNALAWTSPSTGPVVPLYGVNSQLVASNEIPVGNAAFFRLEQRSFTQLQVLLPGQTNAPNTALGYVGTPTPISIAAQGLTSTTVTVYACDATWHIVGGVTDTIRVTSTDGGAYLPPNMSMVNGVATFVDPNGVLFQSAGPQTVTATDLTDGTKTPNTSASVTINP